MQRIIEKIEKLLDQAKKAKTLEKAVEHLADAQTEQVELEAMVIELNKKVSNADIAINEKFADE